jgi:hypothetical protein
VPLGSDGGPYSTADSYAVACHPGKREADAGHRLSPHVAAVEQGGRLLVPHRLGGKKGSTEHWGPPAFVRIARCAVEARRTTLAGRPCLGIADRHR